MQLVALNYLYNILKDNPTIKVELDAHTDTRGKAASNMTLSAARAKSCVDYLVKEKGIPEARLTSKGFGPTQPVVSDAIIKAARTTEEKEAMHAKNRRTEFKVLSFDFIDPNAPKDPIKPKDPTKPEDPEDQPE